MATYQPIHVVQTKRYNHIPYGQDTAEYYEDKPLKFSNDSDYDVWFDSEVELLEDHFRDSLPPIPIQSYAVLEAETVIGADGEEVFISNYEDYFGVYGLERVSVAFESYEYKDVAFFFILEEARRYMQYQGHNLTEPRTYSYHAGYSNKGEYSHFYQLLFDLGENLNRISAIADELNKEKEAVETEQA